MSDRVVGYCPMGCGQTLFVGAGGHITCSLIGCPRPTAVDELLGDDESEHVVMLEESTFSVQHPLRERLDAELFDCDLHQRISELDGPPRRPGRYRVYTTGQWFWMPLAATKTSSHPAGPAA